MSDYSPGDIQKDKNSWETPPELFERLNRVFRFDLDVCATAENTKCEKFFTREENGLAQDWAPHVCWLNPPYSREIAAWVHKAKMEAWKGATVVALLRGDTSTQWYHEYVHKVADVYPLEGRIKFVGAEGSPNFGSMIAIYWPRDFWTGFPPPRGL